MNSYGKRRLYRLLTVLVFGIIFSIVASQSNWLTQGAKKAEVSQPGLYPINKFIDGDTISVNMNGNIEDVRMIGVDTPETHKPNTPIQCYGPEASNYTKSLIGSSRVRLQSDTLDTNRDRYGRLLRYVYLPDGTMVENKLISEGYGFAYTQFPFEKKQEFVSFEAQAKASGKGLWSACNPVVESNGREQTQFK
jgi:micrococcal nuclease